MKTKDVDTCTLKEDTTFKYIFTYNYIAKYIINLFLDFIGSNLKVEVINIVPQNYIIGKNKNISLYYGDIVALLNNGDILSIEMYKNTFDINDFDKSFSYSCRIYSNQEKKKKKERIIYSKDLHKVISLNFIKGNFRNDCKEIVNKHRFKNDLTNYVVKDNIVIYLVRFDKVSELVYNEEEHRFITFLRLLNCEDINDGKKYVRGDKIMEDIIKYVNEWNLKSSEDGLNRLLEDTKFEGRNEEKIATAKNLINLKVPINIIEKATGLSEKQILSL